MHKQMRAPQVCAIAKLSPSAFRIICTQPIDWLRIPIAFAIVRPSVFVYAANVLSPEWAAAASFVVRVVVERANIYGVDARGNLCKQATRKYTWPVSNPGTPQAAHQQPFDGLR